MTYRPYIDGLRAIAVLAVVLFHFDASTLPGGFLGVDVFFVISGFLITQLLLERSELPWKARLGWFYLRRARRILPALLVTAITVGLVASALFLPADLYSLGKYLLLTPVMLANVASATDGGYFAIAGAFLPLNHFWSLAVEEQFYLLYPLMLAAPFAKGIRRHPVAALALVATLSLALCVRGDLRQSVSTFYLMPARAWELMFGGIAALAPANAFDHRRTTEGVALACIGAILGSFFLLDGSTGFPHPPVVIPCAATAVLLLLGRQHPPSVLKLLSIRPLVFTGKISYSLYLWHAPVLMFVRYYAIRSLSGGQLVLSWIAIYVIAVLSWRLVEEPVRRGKVLASRRAFVGVALAGSLVVATTGAIARWGDGLPGRFPDDIQTLTRTDEVPEAAARCLHLPPDRVAAGDLCRLGSARSAGATVVVWGDSHAAVLLQAYETLAQSHGVQIEFAGRPACRPVLGDAIGSQDLRKDCEAFNRAMVLAVQRIHPQVTILNAFWDPEVVRKVAHPEALSPPAPGGEAPWADLARTLREAGSGTCVVLDVPYLPYPLPYALAMARRRGLDTSFLYPKRAEVLARYAHVEDPLRALALERALTVVDPKEAFCPGPLCEIERDGRSLYRDAHHVSHYGALLETKSLEACLAASDDVTPLR